MQVEKFIPGGFALATADDGKKIFFWNALPGERVAKYQITKNKSSYFEAIATKIESPSPFRVKPKDECYLSTSPWQILDYNYELKQKSLLVQEIFREHGMAIDAPEVITDGKDYFYRNKMEYALYFDHKDERIHLAFHARGSHRKIVVESSSLEHPEIFKKSLEIVDDLNRKHEEARRYQSILLRCNQNGEVRGGLFENKKPHPVFDNLKDTILDHEYSYSPNGFFQINLPVYELALREIKNHINTDEVLDLYAGVGTIGLSVARDKKLTLVEVDKSAYKELEYNCKNTLLGRLLPVEGNKNISLGRLLLAESDRNISLGRLLSVEGNKNISLGRLLPATSAQTNIFITKPVLAKSEDVLEYINNHQTVILDPPRAGINKSLAERLLEVTPPKIIYLSCNPATQARDIEILLQKYHIDMVKTYNFFPHTPHIENLVVLSL